MSNKFLNTSGTTSSTENTLNIPQLTATIREAIFGEEITQEELRNLNNYIEIFNANTNLLDSKVNLTEVTPPGIANGNKLCDLMQMDHFFI